MDDSHVIKPKKEKVPVVDTSEEGIEAESELNIESVAIETELKNKYGEKPLKLFKRLAYELSVIGLPLEDACLIVGLEFEKVQNLIASDQTVARLIKVKDLEYKRGLLKVVSLKSKDDDKLATWMLEKRYPAEFNSKKGSGNGGGEGDGDNIVKQAITFIQVNGDNSPLVSRKSGVARAQVMEEKGDTGIMQRIKDILA